MFLKFPFISRSTSFPLIIDKVAGLFVLSARVVAMQYQRCFWYFQYVIPFAFNYESHQHLAKDVNYFQDKLEESGFFDKMIKWSQLNESLWAGIEISPENTGFKGYLDEVVPFHCKFHIYYIQIFLLCLLFLAI